jgi:hypothetical protein
MMNRRIILHSGLHKTGTTYLQNYIFNQLNEKGWIYNYDKLVYHVMDLISTSEPTERQLNKKKLRDYLYFLFNEFPNKHMFVSFEGMSGDLFGGYYNQEQIQNDLYDVFSEFGKVEAIVFLRFQADWILSCFKEAVYEYQVQTYSEFLNLEDGIFQQPKGKFNENSCQSVYAKFLDYDKYISSWIERFDKVNIMFQEDLKRSESEVVQSLSQIFNTELSNRKDDLEVHKRNSGLSWFSILFLIKTKSILKKLSLTFLFPKPIHFFGEGRYVCGIEQYENERFHISKHKLNSIGVKRLIPALINEEISVKGFIQRVLFKIFIILIRPITYKVYRKLLRITFYKQWNSLRKFLKFFIDDKFKPKTQNPCKNIDDILRVYYRGLNEGLEEKYNIKLPLVYLKKVK